MSEPEPGGAVRVHSRDVVELILGDHREFERLFRALRNREEDRRRRLAELSDLLVAHALAEEAEVYPVLRRRAPDESEEIAHSVTEHAEGHEALANLQAVDDVESEQFEQALEELVEAVTHHLDEEERDVLNAARENVPAETRTRLGDAFLRARGEALADRPGAPDKVGELIDDARRRGML